LSTKAVLVSVIIPCFNQGHFLHEAIESILAQTYTCAEIIVVNDGSTDNTAEVVAKYPGLCYVQQNNQGLAAARNTGMRYSTGDYLVFLDADDRLLPRALECGADYLDAHPQCAFVSGHYRFIATDGSVLPTWREQRLGNEHCFISGAYELIGADGAVLRTWPQRRVASEHYTMLLQRNYIAMHATVMYRHTALDTVGGFDTSLRACEDYDLYLRIARQFPIACHDHVVAEYRRHSSNMSGNSALMLTTALAVLHSQWAHVAGNHTYETAFRIGEKTWQYFYTRRSLKEAYTHLTRGALTQALKAALMLWQYGRSTAHVVIQHAMEVARSQLDVGWKRLRRLPIGRVDFGALRRAGPLPRATGFPTGQAVDQYYRERFLHDYPSDMPIEVYDSLILPRIL
jgi:GT2 family glycosyltransferase